MNILAVVESRHMGNTYKIAKAMAEVAPITITNLNEIENYHLHDYDIVGFGSGIYCHKHAKKLMKFVNKLCDAKAYTFVFSTSGGTDFEENNKALVDLLEKKNKIVLGTFGCKGIDKFFFLRLIGGINKSHPDMTDLKNAQSFIRDIMEKYENLK